MQGTWKENSGGWHKDCRRKKQTRKHTIKAKWSIFDKFYYRDDRENKIMDRSIFRIKGDEQHIVYDRTGTSAFPEREWYKVRCSVTVTLRKKKFDQNYKILDSIEDLDRSTLAEQTIRKDLGFMNAAAYKNVWGKIEKPRFSYYRDFDSFYDIKTGKDLKNIIAERFSPKEYYISVDVSMWNKIETLKNLDEFLKTKNSHNKNSTSSPIITYRVHKYDEVCFVYGKPVYYYQRRPMRGRSTASVFSKKQGSNAVRASERAFCKKAEMREFVDEGKITLRRKYRSWW